MLDYLSANSSILNRISMNEALAYLLGALEIEKTGSPWFLMTLKSLADVLFVKAFEAYALESGTCLFEGVTHLYQTFAGTAIPVGQADKGSKVTMIYSRLRVRLVQRNVTVCYACYKTRFMGEDAEMQAFGPLECMAKHQVAQFPSKQFTPYPALKVLHPEAGKPALGLLKSDNIDRKMNCFTVRKAGDGNVKLGESIFALDCVDTDFERVVRSIKMTVVSGGLKDLITVCFLPQLDTNIHTSKPPEDAPRGGVVFQFRKQQASWREGEKKYTQLLPATGTNDTLHFVITSFKKVVFSH